MADKAAMESYIEAHFPILHDFLDTVLWPNSDGGNVIDLLVRFAWLAHPDRANALVRELQAVAHDDELTEQTLSDAFNRSSYRPYVVVSPDTSKDFCLSMAEALEFLAKAKGQPCMGSLQD